MDIIDRQFPCLEKLIALFIRDRSVFFVPLLLLCASCAASPSDEASVTQRLPTDAEVEQHNAQVAPEERIVCREEIPVGTNIPQRRCYFAQQLEEVGRFHREQLRNVLR